MPDKTATLSFVIRKLLALSLGAFFIASCGGGKNSATGSGSAPGSGSSAKGGDFEGTITMTMNAAGAQAMTITYYVKGARARMETTLPGHTSADNAMLWDMSSGKMTNLIISQKTYMTMDMDAVRERAQSRGGASADSRPLPKLTDTGKDETVAGYPCHDWIVGDKQEMQVCIAKGLGGFGMAGNQGAGGLLGRLLSPKASAEAAANPQWAKLTEGGGFPIKSKMTENGATSFTMEATNIERKKVDDSLLAIPADYKEFKAPAIPGVVPPKQ